MDSPSSPAYNLNNPAVKRIMQELKEIQKENSYLYTARPLEDNIFEWHFTIRGPRDTPFEGGIYHGRIILPSEYPFKPPSIVLLTANGRFEVGQKICLSISERHPEHWQPSWSIRTALVALIAFMPTKGEGAIGAIDYSPEERKALAIKSKTWKCEKCNSDNATCLPPEPEIPTTPLRDSSNNVNNNTNIRASAISFSLEPATPNSPKPPTEVSTPLSSSNPSPTRQMTPQQLALLRKREELKQRLSRVTNDNEPAPSETPQTPTTPAPVQNPPPNAEVQPQPTPVVQNQPTTLTLTPDQLRRERILDITITLVLFVLIGLLVRKLFSENSLDDL